MHHWIRWMAKLRWVVLLVWLAAALLSLFALPSLQDILRSSEQRYLPEGAESVAATRLLQNLDPESRSQSGAVIVLSRDQGLTEADIQWMHRLTAKIEADKVQLGVSGVVASQSEPELAERLLSWDGTTLLALVNLPGTDFEDATKQTISRLKALLADSPDGATAALTGNAPLSQDFQQSAETGLRRTEYLTIGLVLAILLLLFRSPITPLLPLVTIGASFIVARGLVAACAQWGIPVSHFTESFLIAVLFGAGTDYCILLLHRYREEWRNDERSGGKVDRCAVLSRTMSGVGGTVLFSASTVFVAFLLLGMAEFGLYRSGFGVAIGMLVTVAAALTLAPALLLTLGPLVFWPGRRGLAEARPQARVGTKLAALVSRRAVLVLVASLIGFGPIALLYQGHRSFNDIAEIDPGLESVVGFRLAEAKFSAGELFPVTVAVTSSQSMRTKSGLAALEQVSSDLAELDFVREVRSAVRPLGRKPGELTLNGRLKGANPSDIIPRIKAEQQSLIAGLKAIALNAAPLSQGLPGMLSSFRQLQESLGQLLAAQLGNWNGQAEPAAESSKSPEVDASREKALNYYVSPDGRTTKLELILKSHPYSNEALDRISGLSERIRDSFNATWLSDPQVFMGGVSAKYDELSDISGRDFTRTSVLVMAGIAALLMLLLRSVLMPLIILLSLGLNYVMTMGLLELLFVRMLGFEGLSWNVSFFVFIIIVALGVDYSIFLMARFKEERLNANTAAAMTAAMSATGGVIVSAASIMAGTFGALAFSGVDTLIQIGIGALVGLLLYATLFMGLIMPACVIAMSRADSALSLRIKETLRKLRRS